VNGLEVGVEHVLVGVICFEQFGLVLEEEFGRFATDLFHVQAYLLFGRTKLPLPWEFLSYILGHRINYRISFKEFT